jgi:putative membrane protein
VLTTLEDAMMGWYGDHMSGWGYLLMSLTTLAFWALVAAAVVLLVRFARGGSAGGTGATGGTAPPAASTPEQILADRLARGEIDVEEYQRRVEVLRRPGDTTSRR